MSNLVPTPRTDKNGVTSIRHMRAQPPSSSPTLPPPLAGNQIKNPNAPVEPMFRDLSVDQNKGFIGKWKERRQREKLSKELVELLTIHNQAPNAIYTYEPARSLHDVDTLISTEDLERAVSVAQLVTSSGGKAADSDRRALIFSLSAPPNLPNLGVRFRILQAHSDWLQENPGKAVQLCAAVERLHMLGNLDGYSDGKVPHMDAYIEAVNHESFKNYDLIAKYHKEFLTAVGQYPDQVDKVINFMIEREMFDGGAFEQWSAAVSPLAEGAL